MERNSRFQRNARASKWLRMLALGALVLLTSACATLRDPEASQEYRSDLVASLEPGTQVGQTFVSRRAGLNGFQLWLRPGSDQDLPAEASLYLELYRISDPKIPLFSTRVSAQRVKAEYPLSVSYRAIQDQPDQEYLLVLRPEGFPLNLYGRNEDAYPHGSLILGDEPVDADLSFRLSYLYDWRAVMADASLVFQHIWLVLPLLVVLWLPGRVLLEIALPKAGTPETASTHPLSGLDWGERTAYSLGLSLPALAVMLVWTTVVGIRWNPTLTWVAGILLAGLLAWLQRRQLPELGQRLKRSLVKQDRLDKDAVRQPRPGIDWAGPGLMGIFLLTLGVRLAMVRDLAAPAWVDSVHHALIIRKILDLGMLPENYLPYVQSQYATYHSGFHSAGAFFTWLSGMPLPSGLLLFSQILNALCIFPVYLLTTNLTRNRLAGVLAAMIGGLFTPMPAYYASWGRFTQLAGLLILPTCFALFLRLVSWLEQGPPTTPAGVFRRPAFPLLSLLGISLAGLALTHYRVLAFLSCLLLAYLAVRWVAAARRKQLGLIAAMHLTVLSLAVGLAVLFSLPWWPKVVQSMVYPHVTQAVSSLGMRAKPFEDFAWGYLNPALGKQAMALAGLGWVLGVLRRRSFTITLLAWIALMFLLANLGAFGLSGLSLVNNTSVEITLFMPLALLGGYLLSEAIQLGDRLLAGKPAWFFRAGALAAVLAAAFWGGRLQLPLLNQSTFLMRQADLPALQWVKDNLPHDETVVINSFIWGYNIHAGSDGGFWMAPLAGLQSLPPPVLYGLSNPVDLQRSITSLSKEAAEMNSDPTSLSDFMQSHNLRYVFIGAKGGILSPKGLVESGLFNPLYQHEGSWVFIINER